MKRLISIILLFISINAYSSTELMIGLKSDVVAAKSFDVVSENDWLFGPEIKINQSIIAGKPLFLQLSFNMSSSSNKIFTNIKTEFSDIFISLGAFYAFNPLRDILYINCGANFIFGNTDIKFVEPLRSYSGSSNTYGGSLFSGVKLNLPVSFFRSKDWEKKHWHEIVTMGIDIQLGYKFLTPLKYENLKTTSDKPENTENYQINLGEINLNGPYIIGSVAFIF